MSNTRALKQEYVELINQYNPHLTHAVTVTFKTRAYVLPKTYQKCTENPNNVFVSAQKIKINVETKLNHHHKHIQKK